MQYPAVPGAYPDPPAVPGAQSDPPAVHVSGNDNSSTAVPIGGTNGELPSDTAREETQPSRAESARNPDLASADVTDGKSLRYTAFTFCKGFCSFCTDDNLCIVGMELAHEWKTIFWATSCVQSCYIGPRKSHQYPHHHPHYLLHHHHQTCSHSIMILISLSADTLTHQSGMLSR